MKLTIDEVVNAVQALGEAAKPFLGSGAAVVVGSGESRSTGLSAPNSDGLVSCDGIEKLRAWYTERGYKGLADMLPSANLIDWWNPKELDVLETLNDAYAEGAINTEQLWLLNQNINSTFFRPLGKPEVPSFKPPKNGFIAQGYGEAWQAPLHNENPFDDSPVYRMTATGDKKWPYKYLQTKDKLIPGGYMWPMNIPADDSYPTAFCAAWLLAMTGVGP